MDFEPNPGAAGRSSGSALGIATLLLGAISLLACGGGDQARAPETSTPERVVMESDAPHAHPEDQPPVAPEPVPVQPAVQETVRFDHVPEMMSDLPMPKQLSLQYGELEAEGTGTARYEGAGDPNSVIDALAGEMEGQGWAVRIRESDEGASMIVVTKEDRIAQATAVELEPGTVRVDLSMLDNEAADRAAAQRREQWKMQLAPGAQATPPSAPGAEEGAEPEPDAEEANPM